MNIENLKKGFGYQKESVYKYIADLEYEFDTKMTEKEAQISSSNQELQKKVEELEAKIAEQQKELS